MFLGMQDILAFLFEILNYMIELQQANSWSACLNAS